MENKINEKDLELLDFIQYRMLNVYHESVNADYMINFDILIEKLRNRDEKLSDDIFALIDKKIKSKFKNNEIKLKKLEDRVKKLEDKSIDMRPFGNYSTK